MAIVPLPGGGGFYNDQTGAIEAYDPYNPYAPAGLEDTPEWRDWMTQTGGGVIDRPPDLPPNVRDWMTQTGGGVIDRPPASDSTRAPEPSPDSNAYIPFKSAQILDRLRAGTLDYNEALELLVALNEPTGASDPIGDATHYLKINGFEPGYQYSGLEAGGREPAGGRTDPFYDLYGPGGIGDPTAEDPNFPIGQGGARTALSAEDPFTAARQRGYDEQEVENLGRVFTRFIETNFPGTSGIVRRGLQRQEDPQRTAYNILGGASMIGQPGVTFTDFLEKRKGHLPSAGEVATGLREAVNRLQNVRRDPFGPLAEMPRTLHLQDLFETGRYADENQLAAAFLPTILRAAPAFRGGIGRSAQNLYERQRALHPETPFLEYARDVGMF